MRENITHQNDIMWNFAKRIWPYQDTFKKFLDANMVARSLSDNSICSFYPLQNFLGNIFIIKSGKNEINLKQS